MTSPPRTLDKIISKLYAENGSITRLRQHMRVRIFPIEQLIAIIPPHSHVLDVGCGDGLLAGLLLDREGGRASSVVGFDSNPKAIRNARQMAKASRFGSSAVFECTGVDSAWPTCRSTAKGQFDVVTMVDIMHHLAPTLQVGIWAKVATTLRSGGLLVYKDMARKPAWMALANRLHDLVFAAQWAHYTDIGDDIKKARDSGLMERDRLEISRLWYRHNLAVLVRTAAPHDVR